MKLEARPYSLEIDPKTTALVVIDMQSDFLCEGGYGQALGNEPSLLRVTIELIRRMLQLFREKGILIIHTREGHLPDLSDMPPNKQNNLPKGGKIGDRGPMGRILVRGEKGHAIIDEVAPIEGEPVIDKPGKNAFSKTALDDVLRSKGTNTLLFVGVTTEICGVTTIAESKGLGYDTAVIEDCMASYEQRRHDDVIHAMSAQGGITAVITDTRKVEKAFAS